MPLARVHVELAKAPLQDGLGEDAQLPRGCQDIALAEDVARADAEERLVPVPLHVAQERVQARLRRVAHRREAGGHRLGSLRYARPIHERLVRQRISGEDVAEEPACAQDAHDQLADAWLLAQHRVYLRPGPGSGQEAVQLREREAGVRRGGDVLQ